MRRSAAALLAAALLALGEAAAQPPSMELERLTSPEVRDAIAAGRTTILIPIGGTEQNGAHMVLGKHNVRARELAIRVASELGNALVAPTIAYVPEGSIEPPSGHMQSAGTISIPVAAFEATLEGAARSMRHHGFRDIVFLGDHGGYRASLDRVAARLNREWARVPARVHPLPEYYRELPHAGREDTAFTLALGDKALVRDAAGADREAGIALYQDAVGRTVAAIKKAVARR